MSLPISVLSSWYQQTLAAFCCVSLGICVSFAYSADIPVSDDDILAQALEAIALEESLESIPVADLTVAEPTLPHQVDNDAFENKIIAFARLSPILDRIYMCKTETDVHQLDGFVSEKTQELLNVGEILGVGEDDLSLAQTSAQLSAFLAAHEEEVIAYIKDVGFKDIQKHIATHFGQMDAEVTVYPNSQQIKQMFSRVWTGAHDCWVNSGYRDFAPLSYMIMQICDNYTTGGGCLAGRIDRGFLAYANLLNHIIND